MAKLLAVAEPDVRMTLELKAFPGIRTEELVRLWWVLINENSGYINVTEAVTKVKQRAVPIFENLKRRLAFYAQAEKRDRVSKRWNSANSLYHVWKRTANNAGLPYKKNAIRNSYISYRLAETKDIFGCPREWEFARHDPQILFGLGDARAGQNLVLTLIVTVQSVAQRFGFRFAGQFRQLPRRGKEKTKTSVF